MFAINAAQTIFLDKYDNSPSKNVGLLASINIVTSNTDSTLLDNANGSYNYAAPGADRLQLSLILSSVAIGSTPPSNFIQLLQVKEGELMSQITGPSYSLILQLLAKRTYDTNGDFTT